MNLEELFFFFTVGEDGFHWVADVEVVFGAGDGDVEEAAFFFDGFDGVEETVVGFDEIGVGECSVIDIDEEYFLPL